MQLSDRLQAVASMVTENSRLADVGTDHGYIPIYLCEMGKIPSAIAMDVKKGPLLRAKMNIERYHMQEKIRTRLSDGVLNTRHENFRRRQKSTGGRKRAGFAAAV